MSFERPDVRFALAGIRVNRGCNTTWWGLFHRSGSQIEAELLDSVEDRPEVLVCAGGDKPRPTGGDFDLEPVVGDEDVP